MDRGCEDESLSKWACMACTYMNLEASSACSMCMTKRGDREPSPAKLSDHLLDSDGQKWECPQCTFLNFASSAQCTMCGGGGGGHSDPLAGVSEDLNKMALVAIPPSLLTVGTGEASGSGNELNQANADDNAEDNDDQKWNCMVCTFKNWSKAGRCQMCRNSRVLDNQMASPLRFSEVLNERELWFKACHDLLINNDSSTVKSYLQHGYNPFRTISVADTLKLEKPDLLGLSLRMLSYQVEDGNDEIETMISDSLTVHFNTAINVQSWYSVHSAFDRSIETFERSFPKFSTSQTFSIDKSHFIGHEGVLIRIASSSKISTRDPDLCFMELTNRSDSCDGFFDSVMQSVTGLCDSNDKLRLMVAEVLESTSSTMYDRWANALPNTRDKKASEEFWGTAARAVLRPDQFPLPNEYLSLYLFAISHIFKRPVMMFDFTADRSLLGVYLPIGFDCQKCFRNPVVLVRATNRKFAPLVTVRPDKSYKSVLIPLKVPGLAKLTVRFVPDERMLSPPPSRRDVLLSGNERQRQTAKMNSYSEALMMRWMKLVKLNPADAANAKPESFVEQDLVVDADYVIGRKDELVYDLHLRENRFSCYA